MYDALFGASVVDQVAPDDRYGSVRKTDSQLGQVVERREGRYLASRQLPSFIVQRDHPASRSLTGNGLRPLCILSVLRHVGKPVFLTGLSSAQTFKTGSLLRSSCCVSAPEGEVPGTGRLGATYCNRDQPACPLDLTHVGDAADIVS